MNPGLHVLVSLLSHGGFKLLFFGFIFLRALFRRPKKPEQKTQQLPNSMPSQMTTQSTQVQPPPFPTSGPSSRQTPPADSPWSNSDPFNEKKK
jgi:hypothetical protein